MAVEETSLPASGDRRLLQASNAWKVLALLFAANLLNFYDRVIPAIVTEPWKLEFGLSDTFIGVLAGAFTVIYALVGLPLGRLADRMSRKKIMGWGLIAWSGMTAATGLAWNTASLFMIRLGVGVGEASYAPAANSTIADLFPADKRSRAIGLFQLGLPIGLLLGYFTVGPIVEAFGSWRAAFFVAAVPGLILAFALFMIREPERGASEPGPVRQQPQVSVKEAFVSILAVRTMWFLILAGIGSNVASYAVNSFTVPLFMRYFGVGLTQASVLTGIVIGLTGLVGLLGGGWLSDKADHRGAAARVQVGAIATLIAAVLTFIALRLGQDAMGLFVVVMSLGWLLQYMYYTSAYPAVADVIPPRLRSTAVAVFFAAFYIFGGALGPIIAGALSDSFAASAIAGGAGEAEAIAEGLRQSLALVAPVGLLIGAIGLFLAARTIAADNERMKASLSA